jgi:hypothetical protein
MSEYDEAVERRARAIWEFLESSKHELPWPRLMAKTKNHYRDMARATMEADSAAGYALVKREATGNISQQLVVIAARKAEFLASRGFINEQDALDQLNEAINFGTELALAAGEIKGGE